MLVAVLWNIWLERNHLIFKGQRRCAATVLDMILSQVSLWAAKYKEFEGYSSADILRSWKALFEDGRHRLNHVSS